MEYDSPTFPALVAQGRVADDFQYAADYIVEAVNKKGSFVVIPPKSNRKIQRQYNTALYKERNLIERMFNKLKQFRRIATRYDKTALSFFAFLCIAGIC